MDEKSSVSSSSTWLDAPQRASVERFLERVRQLDPLLVVLFGSLATGDYTSSSDADVLVVFREPVDWETVYACSDGVVQPVVTTWEELIAQLDAGEPFFHEVITGGTVLLDAEGVGDVLRRRAADAARKLNLERTLSGWKWG
ncbi:MAG: nucleotidyltransferase domain-containing protein [Thermoflexales bacterium]|nr:nucleotidyltransferase domain-containing protein [Thermoflexales bacterium]